MKKLLLVLFFAFAFLFFGVNSASAQTCTTTPPTNTGTVTLSATTTSGTYRVWARMKAASSTNNSFYIRFNSGCAILVGDNTSISSTGWTWVDYQNGNTASKIDATVGTGNQVVTIIGNEPGVGVDKILMTKNTTCIPTGTSGDNCPAEVTLTPTPTIGAADTTPPVISNPRAEEVTGTTAKIRWELSENASGQVEYRVVGSSTWIPTQLQPCTPTDCAYAYHIQTLSGLTNGTTYEYRIKSSDAAGNPASFPNICRFTTGGAATQACSGNPTSTNTPTPTLTPTKTPTPIPTATLTPTKTPTPTVTPTPVPSSTVLKFNSVKLHGIGTGGDNSNPTSTSITVPLRTTRTLSVELIDGNGNTLPIQTGNIVYRTASGDFAGDIIAGTAVPSGTYLIKVKSPQYLKRQLTGIITVTAATTNTLPNVVLVTGDINNDNSLSIADYNILIDCYSDLLPAKNCADQSKKDSADLSDDGKVDASDYNLFLRELSVVSGN